MHKTRLTLTLLWISLTLIPGCTRSTTTLFGEPMPTMKTIHDQKFHHAQDSPLDKPSRSAADSTQDTATAIDTTADTHTAFYWLPNPTLTMYVFKHLTAAGQPVPGYSTVFRFYTQDVIAMPGERAGWE